MKKTNKFLSIILAILMVVTIIPITASAADPTSGTCGENVTWEYNESTNTMSISGQGPMYGYEVDAFKFIDERPWITYDRQNELEQVVIDEGITGIGYNSFNTCFKLRYVTLPASVTYIDENAFYDCPILIVHYLGTEEEWNNVTVYSGNENLLNAKFYFGDYKPTSDSGTCGENVTWTYDGDTRTLTIAGTGAMNNYAFDISNDLGFDEYKYDGDRPWEDYKYEIQKVVVSNGVTAIGNNAFRLFVSLKDVEISNSVTKINYRALYHCDNLTDIYYSGTEEEWNSITKGTIENVTIHYNHHTHDYETVITAPTCTERGYTTYTCECGDSYVDDYVNATGHNYTSEITTQATHTTTGIKTFSCTCGDSYTEVIAKLEKHNYESVITAPTCSEQGYTTYTCECGDSYVDDYVNATGHEDNHNDGICDVCNTQLCDHDCHKEGIKGIFWRIINIFNMLFGLNKTCSCGVAHY